MIIHTPNRVFDDPRSTNVSKCSLLQGEKVSCIPHVNKHTKDMLQEAKRNIYRTMASSELMHFETTTPLGFQSKYSCIDHFYYITQQKQMIL